MNHHPIRIITSALLAFCGPLISNPAYGQDAKAPATVSAKEKEAIDAYENSLKEGRAKNAGYPANSVGVIDRRERIMGSAKTEGLPEELGKAFKTSYAFVKKLSAKIDALAIPKEVRNPPEKLHEWLTELLHTKYGISVSADGRPFKPEKQQKAETKKGEDNAQKDGGKPREAKTKEE
jgi:hypothetical protein